MKSESDTWEEGNTLVFLLLEQAIKIVALLMLISMSWQKSYMNFMGSMKFMDDKKINIGTYTRETDPMSYIQESELRYTNCRQSLAANLRRDTA